VREDSGTDPAPLIGQGVAVLDRAIPLRPGYVESWRLRGMANLRLSEFAEVGSDVQLARLNDAVRDFDKVFELDPRTTGLHRFRGIALLHRGGVGGDLERKRLDLGEAVRELKRAAGETPDMWEVFANLGDALALLGEKTEAVEAYGRALKLNPAAPGVRENLELLGERK
jgi:Flp pilus assembly protein TadD